MARDDQPLKRLGGGRWQTRDGRFRIESDSGRWVVVDAEQTDELGLPRVRGPFESLTSARAAIDALADAPAEPSPLAASIATRMVGAAGPEPTKARERASPRGTAEAREAVRSPTRVADTAPEPVPTWLAAVRPVDRARAAGLHAALDARGVPEPAAVAAAEVAGPGPAVATALLRQRLEEVVREALGGTSGAPAGDASAIVDAVLAALDEPPTGELPGWSLVERRAGGGLARPIRR